MRTQNISEILYRHDPGSTCCNVNEGMEDEYDRLAAEIASVPASDLTLEIFHAILSDAFDEDLLDNDAVTKSYAAIRNL